ncbi:phenylalanine--tRNA ligase subunit alpha [Candidatus Dojkabacteria bacterium]|nr:phenylalanine--tRNA ligase subunit alpha [Candidatus Dojkabacteria bacterium]
MIQDVEKKLKALEIEALASIKKVSDLQNLKDLQVKYIGRKSELVEILRNIKDLDKEAKIAIGKLSNEIKNKIEKEFEAKESILKNSQLETEIKGKKLDLSIPSNIEVSKLHPITQMLDLTIGIFQRMGFEIEFPFEVDTPYNNFTAVNIPEDHPVRDVWDTFWTDDGHVAITHTSSMQHRILKNNTPPIRFIIPGKTFRNEATDARHEHTFYQIEGIYVDKGINMSHLIGVLKEFLSVFFEQDINVLFTPDFFPFVEPGGMLSVDCSKFGDKFEKVSKGTGWLEILGCGMIHPNVLELAGLDSNVYSGFAWGIGLERLIMLKYGIDDIRLFHSGDIRFIRQF